MENDEIKIPEWLKMLIAIFGFSILFFIFAVMLKKYFCFEISSDSIVLAFVGIAATFIVVSNYAQVKEIEKSIDTQINTKIQESKSKIDDDINKLKNKIIMNSSDLSELIRWLVKETRSKKIEWKRESNKDKDIRAFSSSYLDDKFIISRIPDKNIILEGEYVLFSICFYHASNSGIVKNDITLRDDESGHNNLAELFNTIISQNPT